MSTSNSTSAVIFDSPSLKIVSRKSKGYKFNLEQFRKQFNNVSVLTKVYLNVQGMVYAGEWRDEKGVINFNAGYAIDLHKTIEYQD